MLELAVEGGQGEVAQGVDHGAFVGDHVPAAGLVLVGGGGCDPGGWLGAGVAERPQPGHQPGQGERAQGGGVDGYEGDGPGDRVDHGDDRPDDLGDVSGGEGEDDPEADQQADHTQNRGPGGFEPGEWRGDPVHDPPMPAGLLGGVAGLPFQQAVLVAGGFRGPHLAFVAGGAVGVAPPVHEDTSPGQHVEAVSDQRLRCRYRCRRGGDGDGVTVCRRDVAAVELPPRPDEGPGVGVSRSTDDLAVDDLALDHDRPVGAGVGAGGVGAGGVGVVVQGDDRRQRVVSVVVGRAGATRSLTVVVVHRWPPPFSSRCSSRCSLRRWRARAAEQRSTRRMDSAEVGSTRPWPTAARS
ncbi:hypothetical protein Ae331Ps2_6361 [Pseudonocardia sp. Ae331_Ps2]|nr:hypothetical protein Ae331Ps2_6361 [Pseudonocardia sp. Ae331_Ps2]